ncbi:bcl-2-binding component 3, isoforms 3/4-like [Cebus imitator]|uniref:bcl-2-binding component 3, isoforms 3/4-like n=1 Tax=Cebus imitator TaxID=2715852 RepID=UPI000809DFAF|nr:bcl-2-binding component 3, isoforms 3/4-like [Cebus imitator]
MQQDGGKERERGGKKKKKAPDTQSMARRSDCLASRIPLGSVENEPREGNFNSSTTPCRALRFPRVGRSRVQPASASCSWGAVTSQIPASLFIPFCSGSKTPAVFTPALAGPAPGAHGGPGWRRQRLRRRWVAVAAAAAPPPRGQCRPRAALRRPPRDRCRPPRSVAECYPVLNVTLTHSIPDTTALTSSIHAARAAIGRASRPGGAVLPLRPFITPGRGLRRRRGVGGAGDAGSRGFPGCVRLAGGRAGGARGGPGRVPWPRDAPRPGCRSAQCRGPEAPAETRRPGKEEPAGAPCFAAPGALENPVSWAACRNA